jgi:hypothetical protein
MSLELTNNNSMDNDIINNDVINNNSMDNNSMNNDDINNDAMDNNIDIIKQNICHRCLQFNKETLISILNFLKREHIDSNLFKQNSDGVRINLDRLNNSIIHKLNNYVEYKLNEEKKSN